MWRAGPAKMRRGNEAMWQGRAWPACGAGGVDKWQEAKQNHADTREGRHVVGGRQVKGPRVSGSS